MRSIVVGTAGHIDHGKSALVRALTGIDPDRLKEEKARGITIDLGFAHAEVEGMNLAFVDVPGHERFVKNMLAGAGGIDLVMLVVAADESVMPQTREHFQICRLLHVPAGLIVLTKSDLADGDMLEIARMDVAELAAGSFLEGAPVVAVSSRTGAGLDQVRQALAALARTIPERGHDGPVRLPIDRVFSVRGFGTVVTGTLVAGEMREGDELLAVPRGVPVKVRGLQVHGAAAPSAAAGRRLAVNIGGVEVGDLARGDTLTLAGALEPTQRLDAVIDLLDDAQAVEARRARTLSPRNDGVAGPRGDCGGARRGGSRRGSRLRRVGVRPHSPRTARRADAGRPLHRPGLFPFGDHRWRSRARPAPAAFRDPDRRRGRTLPAD